MIFSEKVLLSSKTEMPRLAFGTWQIPGSDVVRCVSDAIKAGYRHIDTAQSFGVESLVGQAVRESGVPREDIFVSTKVPAGVKSVEGAISSILASLKSLNLGYIDMLLIHSPLLEGQTRGVKRFFKENLEVWRVMEKFFQDGSVRAIGVSNFNRADLRNIVESCQVRPVVNQIKMYAGSSASVMVMDTLDYGIVPMAYSPLGHGKALLNERVIEMAAKYGVSPARLCLRYVLQKGCCVAVKTLDAARMAENGNLDFEIAEPDMKMLSCLGALNTLLRHRYGGDNNGAE